MNDNLIEIYVKTNNSLIIAISNSCFIKDTNDWIKIDSGSGNKYEDFRTYLEKGIFDEECKYNYKLVDGKPVELTNEEKEKLFPTKAQEPTQEELLIAQIIKDGVSMKLQIANLTAQISKLTGGIK